METPLEGGWVTTGVVRVGETVRRPAGPNAEQVQRLLELVGKPAHDLFGGERAWFRTHAHELIAS